MTFKKKLAGVLVVVASFVAAGAHADLIRITELGMTVSEQDASGNTHPVVIGADGFRLTFHGGGSQSILDPLIIIFATPTPGTMPGLGVSATNPAFNSVTMTVGGTNRYGGTWNTTTGFAGIYDENTSKDSTGGQITVYERIGFMPDGVNSENYPNFTTYTPETSWDLYVVQLEFDPDFSKGNWIEFDTTGLDENSFVMGYGCTRTTSTTSGVFCRNEGSTQSTPFTFAGLVKEVPSPSSLALFAIGLALLSARRRLRTA